MTIVFLIIGSYLIVQYNNIDLEEEADRKAFLLRFADWIFKVGKSTKSVVGYATKQEWLPDETELNKTNTTTFLIFEE